MKNYRNLLIALIFAATSVFVIGCDDDDDTNNNNTNNTNPVCSNGILEAGETCDGTDFGTATCETMGDFTGGTLLCSADCQTIETTNCTNTCTNECELGNLVCNGDTLRSCVNDTETGCTVWEDYDCSADGDTCAVVDTVAQCVDECVDACTEDDTRCTNDVIETCLVQTSGCTNWTAGTDCTDTNQACDMVGGAATCVDTCVPECTAGDTRCTGTVIDTCTDPGDGCTVWTAGTDCLDTTQICFHDGTAAACINPPSGEDCSTAIPVTVPFNIAGDDFTADFPGNDLVSFTGTGCENANGVDAVFSVELTQGATYIIMADVGLDGVINIQETCGATNVCLASVDDPEELVFAPATTGTYYIIYEAYSATPFTKSYNFTLIELEPTEVTCDDGIDNDNDGDIDCEDTDCTGTALCGDENTTAFCSDNFDNDADGDIDCDDTDCFGVVGACDTESACDDGVDNDADGNTDCADSDCTGIAPCGAEDTEAACADSFDNDGDGLIDCADSDCGLIPSCQPRMGIYEQFISGGNDLEGKNITFTPDLMGGYTFAVSDLGMDWFIDPGTTTGATSVAMSDSGVWTKTLPFTFDFWGDSYTEVRVSANGFLSFNTAQGTENFESTSIFFSNPMIAAAWDDLTYNVSGDLIWFDAGVDTNGINYWAVTWEAKEYGTTNQVWIQAVLFEDGVISIDYWVNEIGDSIVGISKPGVAPNPTPVNFVMSAGDIIFTEIMFNSASASEPEGEYIELYNTTPVPVSLAGCTIDDGEGPFTIGEVVIPANGYVVFEYKGTGIGVIPTAYALTTINLSNSGDQLTLNCGGIDLDFVDYTGATSSNGRSIQLDPAFYNHVDNDNIANWHLTPAAAAFEVSTVPYAHYGTPGALNVWTITVFSEDFSTWPLTGWTAYDGATTSNVDWYQCNGCSYSLTNSVGAYLAIDTFNSGEVADRYFEMPSIDLTGVSNAVMTFNHRLGFGDVGSVDISIDGGTIWTTLSTWNTSTNGTLASVDLSSANNVSDVRIRFHYVGNYDYYWLIDNLKVGY